MNSIILDLYTGCLKKLGIVKCIIIALFFAPNIKSKNFCKLPFEFWVENCIRMLLLASIWLRYAILVSCETNRTHFSFMWNKQMHEHIMSIFNNMNNYNYNIASLGPILIFSLSENLSSFSWKIGPRVALYSVRTTHPPDNLDFWLQFWILKDTIGHWDHLRTLKDTHWCLKTLLDTCGHSWLLVEILGYLWTLFDTFRQFKILFYLNLDDSLVLASQRMSHWKSRR